LLLRWGLIVRYESGARMAHGTLYADQSFPYGLLGPADVLWRPVEKHIDTRTVWLRMHPSIYHQAFELLNALIREPDNIASSSSAKSKHSSIKISEVASELDSFEIMGPKAARVLRRILRLSKTEGKDKLRVSVPLQLIAAAPN
jgi:ribonuclease P/MRP protein subunit POP1